MNWEKGGCAVGGGGTNDGAADHTSACGGAW